MQEGKCTVCSVAGDTCILEHYLLDWNRFSNDYTSIFYLEYTHLAWFTGSYSLDFQVAES